MATQSQGNIQIDVNANTSPLLRSTADAVRQVESKTINLNINDRAFTERLGRISGASSEFEKSLAASNARVIAFGASASILYGVEKAFSTMVKTTIDVEKSLTNINVILNASSGNLQQFGTRLFDIAKNTGSSFKVAAEAATELARRGLTLEETLKQTNDALILSRISSIDAKDALADLTAIINAFSNEALNSTTIINKLVNVDSKFAVSAGDAAEAIKRVGSTASQVGVNFDQLIAIITSAQQITQRGGPVVGNALKSIFTRIERPQVLDQLDAIGVKVRDLQGHTLPAINVLQNLAKTYDTLSNAQKSQITQLAAGLFQANQFRAIIGDLAQQNSIYNNALKTSIGTTNEAIDRNERLNETLATTANRTAVNLTQAGSTVGNLTLGPMFKNVLGDVNKALESFNSADSQSAGVSIAKGILTGIGQYLSGPGLLLISAAVLKVFSQFAKFGGDALKGLVNLNPIIEHQLMLEKQINIELQKNPSILSDYNKGLITTLDLQTKILTIIKEQTIRQDTAKLLSGIIAPSLVQSGNLQFKDIEGSLSVRTKEKYLNLSPLDDAINREKLRGVGDSLIRVGNDARLISKDNPMGLGVYNLKDEPLGLSQGVNRVTSSGASSAIKGTVPNFAEFPYIPTTNYNPFDLYAVEQQQSIKTALDKLIFNLKATSPGIEDIRIKIQKFGQQFNIDPSTIPNLISSASKTVESLEKTRQKINNQLGGEQGLFSGLISQADIQTKNRNEISAFLRTTQVSQGNILPDDPLDPNSPLQIKRRQAREAKLLAQVDQQNTNSDDQNKIQQIQRSNRLTNRLFMAGLLAPGAAGIINQGISGDSTTGRGMQSITSGLANTVSFAGTGALVGGGAPGAIIGGSIGLISAISNSIKAFTDTLPDLQRNLEKLRETNTRSNETFSQYLNNAQRLYDIESGRIPATNREINDTINQQQSLSSQILSANPSQMPAINAIISSGGPDMLKNLSQLFAKISDENAQAQRLGKTGIGVNQISSNFGLSGMDYVKVLLAGLGGPGNQVSQLSSINTSKFGNAAAGVRETADSLFGIQGSSGQNLTSFFGSNTSESNTLLSNLRKSDSNNFNRSFNKSLDQIGLPPDQKKQIVDMFGEIPKEVLPIFIDEIKKKLTPESLSDSKTANDKLLVNIKQQIDIYKDQNLAIFKIIEGLKNFSAEIEHANKVQIQSSSFMEELQKTLFQQTLGNVSPFLMPEGVAALKNVGATDSLNLAKQQGVVNANSKFSVDITKLFTSGLETMLKKAVEEGASGKELDTNISNKVQEFANPFISSSQNIANLIQGGKSDEAIASTKSLINEITNNPLLVQGRVASVAKGENIELNFLLDAKEKLKALLTSLAGNIDLVNRNYANQSKNQKVLTDIELDNINTNKRLNFGGGVKGLLSGQNNFERSGFSGNLLSSIGSATNSPILAAMGAAQDAETLQTLGAPVSSEMQQIIARGIKARIDQIFNARGIKDIDSSMLASEITANKFQSNTADVFKAFDIKNPNIKSNGRMVSDFNPLVTKAVGSLKPLDNEIETIKLLSDELKITNDIATITKSLTVFDQKRLQLQTDLEKGLINALHFEMQIAVAKQQQLLAVTRQSFNGGIMSGSDFARQAQVTAQTNANAGIGGVGAGVGLFSAQFANNQIDQFNEINAAAIQTAQIMKSSFTDAFVNFANGTKTASNAFRDFALSVATTIEKNVFSMATNSIFSMLLGPNSSLGSTISNLITPAAANRGGLMGYSAGGVVAGGSGVKDDVPAVLSAGDYVLNKSAVTSIGASKLNALNANTNLSNQFNFNDPYYPTAGGFNVSPFLSTLGQTDKNNPQNRIKFTKEKLLYDYVNAKASYDARYAEALKQYNDGAVDSVIAGLISTGAMEAGAGFGAAAAGSSATQSVVSGPGGTPYISDKLLGMSYPAFASGGINSSDNVSAMLTGGEFVVNKDVVKRFGVPFFDSLNRGQKPGYASGGLVGDNIFGASTTNGATSSSDSLIKLIEISQAIQTAIEDGNTKLLNARNSPTVQAAVQSANGVTNNINITVAVDNNGQANSQSNAQSSGGGSNNNQQQGNSDQNKQNATQLANLIKAVVIDTIIQQKRNGGILTSNSL